MRLTYALIFHDRGIPIIPCYRDSKAILQGYGVNKSHIPDVRFLYNWIENKSGNYALVTGHHGLVVIDFDDEAIYREWVGEAGKLASTYTVATSRGFHVYYQADDLRSFKGNGYEVMGRGRAVMGAYCRHPDGAIYQPVNAPSIVKIESVRDFFLLSKNAFSLETAPSPETPQQRKGQAREGDSAIDLIKSSWPVLEAVRLFYPDSYNSLKGEGRWRRGLCPFHHDKNPSFWIDTERNLFGCHACQVHGDVINLVARAYKITSSEAIKGILNKNSLSIRGVK